MLTIWVFIMGNAIACKSTAPRLHRGGGKVRHIPAILSALAFSLIAREPALADQVVNCGGAAMAGGAELMCSHVQPAAPPQVCTYSWTLMSTIGTLSTIQGSFLLPPGASNQPVYQGYGFSNALSEPIVLCQGRKS